MTAPALPEIRSFGLDDTEAVVEIWRAAGLVRPWNDPYADIRRKLSVQPELFLVAVEHREIVGTVMAGYDGHRGWLSYLATRPGDGGRGIGRLLVATAERGLLALGCPKVQLMVRPENTAVHGFYAALGYEPFEVWTTGKRLIAD